MKNRIITAAFLLLLLASNALATGDKTNGKNKTSGGTEAVVLTGTVVDKTTGESLAGVLVKIDETGTAVYSDFEGNFEVSVLPGTYTVTSAMISYETAKTSIKTEGSQNKITVSLSNVSKK